MKQVVIRLALAGSANAKFCRMMLLIPLGLGLAAVLCFIRGCGLGSFPQLLARTHAASGPMRAGPPLALSLGLLCDYYEHGIEHAPPRDPRGVMQARETFYIPPQDPLELLRS